MTKVEQIRDKAKRYIAGMKTSVLLEAWEKTTDMNSPEIPMVRGWMMDEFERRNPEGFNAWMEGPAEDDDLRNYMI